MIGRRLKSAFAGLAFLLAPVGMAGTMMMTPVAAEAEDTFHYELLPANPCTFNGRPCGKATILSSEEQSCLAGGGKLVFGKSATCWAPAGVKIAKSGTIRKLTDADSKSIDSCVSRNESVTFEGGNFACVGTPAEVIHGGTAGPAKIGPPGTTGDEHKCPPNCLKATGPAPTIPAKSR
jgi:hypothetical protein